MKFLSQRILTVSSAPTQPSRGWWQHTQGICQSFLVTHFCKLSLFFYNNKSFLIQYLLAANYTINLPQHKWKIGRGRYWQQIIRILKLGFLSFSFVFSSFWTLNVATYMYNSLKSLFWYISWCFCHVLTWKNGCAQSISGQKIFFDWHSLKTKILKMWFSCF